MYRKGMDLLAGILPIMCSNHVDVQFIIGEFLYGCQSAVNQQGQMQEIHV